MTPLHRAAENGQRAMVETLAVLGEERPLVIAGIVGIAEVVKEGYPDHTAFDPEAKYYDPKSDPDDPRWFMVDVTLVEKFTTPVTLRTMKHYADSGLENFRLLARGNRLSVMPVSEAHWNFILSLRD